MRVVLGEALLDQLDIEALELGELDRGELPRLRVAQDPGLEDRDVDGRGRLVAVGAPGEIATESLLAEHYAADVHVIEPVETTAPPDGVPKQTR